MPVRPRGRALNVLLYNERFAPHVGGAETVIALLAEDLHERGERVSVVTETPADAADVFAFRVVRRPSRRELRQLVREADVVHLHSFHARLLVEAKRLRRRLVYTYHDLTPICPNGTKLEPAGPCLHPAGPRVCHRCLRESGADGRTRKLLRPVVKSVLSVLIDANVCVSGFALRRYPLWRKQLITSGIDTNRLRPGGSVSAHAAPRVVFVGRLVREKGCEVLLRALRLCSDAGVPFELDIVGSGPERAGLVELAQRLQLAGRVHFHGEVARDGVVEILQRAHVAVVPSIWDEPFGLVAAEAFSCGLPVIAADVGGLAELVESVGLSFPRGDARQLAERLERVLSDAALRRRLAAEGRRRAVAHYDQRAMGAAYQQLYRRLVHA